MKFEHVKHLNQRKKADALVIPFWKSKNGIELAFPLHEELIGVLSAILSTEDFKAKEGEITYLYVEGEPEKRFALLGLGPKEKNNVDSLRRAYGCLTKSCLAKIIKSINVLIPDHKGREHDSFLRGIVEGLLLPNYYFNRLKHQEKEEPEESLLKQINFICPKPDVLNISEKVYSICEGVYFARDLINGNADDVTPQFLAECATKIAKKYKKIKTTVFDKKRIEKEKLSLLLAVNRGSSLDPAFIIMEYKGNPSSTDHTVIVGKGITYDTGGLNLKPTGGMETMKCDMAGAAACFGVIVAASLLQLKVNLTIVVPSTENSIDANSFKPGDVYQSYLGKTVEMTNSDAEGRLVLADGLAYSVKNLKPTRLIDIATLTGAIDVALGSEASGLMSSDDQLANVLLHCGEATAERLWRMPLFDEYKDRLKSEIADLKSWNGRPAGASVAATFLRQFVDASIPWAHIDIASTAFLPEPKKYLPKYGTAFGVRLLVEFLEQIEKEKKGAKR